MFVGLALVSSHIVPLLIGPRWLPDVPLIQLQSAYGVAVCIGTLQAGLITSQGKANWWFYYQLLMTTTTAATIILFAHFGLTIMLLAMVMKAYAIWVVPVRNTLTLLSMPAKQYLLNFKTPFLATSVMAIAIQSINLVFRGQSNLEALILDIVVGIAVYLAIVYSIDRMRINSFIGLLRPASRKFEKPV
jgi:O-antigen/teichoic acid export membrane protein